jgi:hypothetical protein
MFEPVRLLPEILVIIIAMTGIVYWYKWAKAALNWRYAILPISILAHVALYYLALIVTGFLAIGPVFQVMTIWEHGVTLHGIITLLEGAIIMLYEAKREKHG